MERILNRNAASASKILRVARLNQAVTKKRSLEAGLSILGTQENVSLQLIPNSALRPPRSPW
jgi:hypothetical protein